MNILIFSLIISLSVIAIWSFFWEEMIFEKEGEIISHAPSWFYKISIGCPICMVPYWGISFYAIYYTFYDLFSYQVDMGIGDIFLTLLIAMGLNCTISKVIFSY